MASKRGTLTWFSGNVHIDKIVKPNCTTINFNVPVSSERSTAYVDFTVNHFFKLINFATVGDAAIDKDIKNV